jgi:hypothetical protein
VAGLIDELAQVLEAENTEYTTLIDLSTEKTGYIIKSDIENLQRVVDAEQKIVDRVNTLERNRESIVKDICTVLKIPPEELTVKVLIELLHKQKREHDMLQDVHTRLRRTVDKMVQINERNMSLMKESLEMIDFEINLIKGLRMAPETNNYDRGAYSAGGTNYSAGAFDAKQ